MIRIFATDDASEAEILHNAANLYYILSDLDNWLRDQVKYHDRPEMQEVRDYLRELCEDEGVNMDKMGG